MGQGAGEAGEASASGEGVSASETAAEPTRLSRSSRMSFKRTRTDYAACLLERISPPFTRDLPD